MLNKVWVDNNCSKQDLSKNENYYPKNALHIYTENEPPIDRNEVVLNNLPGEPYTIEVDDKITDNCKYQLTMILAAQKQKQTNTGGKVA